MKKPNNSKSINLCNKIIELSFYALFFFVPLILTPLNYELFEYNKMMLVYGLTVIIGGAWFIKMALNKKLQIQRTPLDIPILIFLISQALSTFFSIDRHVSIWGYYSRFHGGLLSTISYILLYYAFATNFGRDKKGTFNQKRLYKLLLVVLASAIIVTFYGVLERLGIDKDIWVQDVQNRVFSTLGQPNWLAAYLCILLPLTLAFSLTSSVSTSKETAKLKTIVSKIKTPFLNRRFLIFFLLSSLFYLCLLFTKSRSGFFAFWVSFFIFFFLSFIKHKKTILKPLLLFTFSFLIFNFLIGTPFAQLNKFTSQGIFKPKPTVPPPQPIGPALETGVTESGEIRRIVWKGALEIIRHYPVFGTGVETFAFSYYKFKPIEHNLTSEWDFLYNKAHNEFLNYAANTGLFGLGSYLLIIIAFGVWFLRWFFKPKSNSEFRILNIALFSGWLSILITNFFGFSVVIVALFFFLIPVFSFVLSKSLTFEKNIVIPFPFGSKKIGQKILISATAIISFLLLYRLSILWWADTLFAKGYNLLKANEVAESYESLRNASLLNQEEPLYKSQFSLSLAKLAVIAATENEATLSSKLKSKAIAESTKAVEISPHNVNLWKERTRVFYYLSSIEEKYTASAIESLLYASTLAPSDPKIFYNLGLLYGNSGEEDQAIRNLKKSIELKPNYRDPYFALALFYKQEGKHEKAKEQLNFILEKINPNDKEAQKQLEEL